LPAERLEHRARIGDVARDRERARLRRRRETALLVAREVPALAELVREVLEVVGQARAAVQQQQARPIALPRPDRHAAAVHVHAHAHALHGATLLLRQRAGVCTVLLRRPRAAPRSPQADSPGARPARDVSTTVAPHRRSLPRTAAFTCALRETTSSRPPIARRAIASRGGCCTNGAPSGGVKTMLGWRRTS